MLWRLYSKRYAAARKIAYGGFPLACFYKLSKKVAKNDSITILGDFASPSYVISSFPDL
jgi:hypothetical protein